MGKHVADLIAPLHGFDVPGEGDEVAPIAVLAKHCDRGVDIAGSQRGVELAKKGSNASIRGCVEHSSSRVTSPRRLPGSADRENCARLVPLASRNAASIEAA